MTTVRKAFPRLDDNTDLLAIELAALDVASRQLKFCRDELEPGTHDIDVIVQLTGQVTIGQPTTASGPAAYQDVLAYVLSRLSEEQRSKLASAIESGISVSDADRDMAKKICLPTRKQQNRRGAITGHIVVSQ